METPGYLGCQRAPNHVLNISTDETFTPSYGSFFLVRDHSNAEGMLATPGVTPLWMNFESMTDKPREIGENLIRVGRALLCTRYYVT